MDTFCSKMSVASNVAFTNFCDLCNKLIDEPKIRKIEILSKFIENWRISGETLKMKNTTADVSFFPIMRFLLPQLDRERGAYGIKENTLAKMYIRVLCLPSDGSDAKKLLNYRAPKDAGNEAGDFASVSYWILKKRCATGGELSVEDVNTSLSRIAAFHSQHEPRSIDNELMYLLQNTSANEQKWLIRIILKDMKFGIGQSAVFNTFHVDAKDLYDVCNNLSKVCEKLNDPSKRLNEVELELFSPFRPMLSEEMDVRRVDDFFNRTPYFFIETKLDGERFQLHMENGKYMYFSRNGFNYTSSFGSSESEGILTPLLSKQIAHGVESLILDGEMMCWNPQTLTYTTKGMEIDVKKLKPNNVHRPCFCVFDILLLNGKVLTNSTLLNRTEILEKTISPLQGVVSLVKRSRISTKEEVWNALNTAIDDCEERIILKEFLSVYKPNARNRGGWYKIKPEYTDGLMDTVDMLIIGGYHGGGRHKGGISHFLLAVTSGAEPSTFLSAARVGSGYSMAVLESLQAQLGPYWKIYPPGTIPPRIECTKEKPDVWIQPEKSVILEVKASEIIPSDAYKTGFTLRFPRVVKVRADKSWTDCISLADFEEKRRNTSGKLTVNRLSDEGSSSPTKKRKVMKSAFSVDAQFKAADTSNVKVVSDILKGKEICVIGGFGQKTKTHVEKKVVRYGGTVVQNPGVNTWCVLAEDENFRVKNIIDRKQHDVVQTSWLLSHLKSETLPEFTRHSYLGMSLRTEAHMQKNYDEFGDHYTINATEDSLRQSMALVKKETMLSEAEKAELDLELFSELNPFRIFRTLVAYADPVDLTDFDISLALMKFTFNGGLRSDVLDHTVTHVICNTSSEQHSKLKDLRRERATKFRIVSPDWVSECVTSKTICTIAAT